MTIICGIRGKDHIFLGCDSWSHKQDMAYGGASTKYSIINGKNFGIGVVSAGSSHVFGDNSRKPLCEVATHINVIYETFKNEISSTKSFIDNLEGEFNKELNLLKDIMFEEEKDEKKREFLRNWNLIYKFLVGGCFNNILQLEYLNLTFESDYSVKVERKKINLINRMYFDGTSIVKGDYGIKLANKIGAKVNTGTQPKNQKALSNYIQKMIDYDKRKNPELGPDFTGRSIGGDLIYLVIRNNSVKVKK